MILKICNIFILWICLTIIEASNYMSDLRSKLNIADKSILSSEYISSLPEDDYSFLINYLKNEDPAVRLLALKFCRKVTPSNAMEIYLEGLHIYPGSRAAAKGILEFNPKVEYSSILIDEINKILLSGLEFPESTIDKLVLTLGNIAELEDIKKALPAVASLNKEETNNAMIWALAKKGDQSSIEKLLTDLKLSNINNKDSALNGIAYIDDSSYIKNVAPLLWDSSFVTDECSDGSMPVYIWGKALNVLYKIDKDFKAIKNVPNKSGHYNLIIKEIATRNYSDYKPDWVK